MYSAPTILRMVIEHPIVMNDVAIFKGIRRREETPYHLSLNICSRFNPPRRSELPNNLTK